MEPSGTPTVKSQDHPQTIAHLKLPTTTSAEGMYSDPLWKKLKQICRASPRVDAFDAHSFDKDAKVLDDRFPFAFAFAVVVKMHVKSTNQVENGEAIDQAVKVLKLPT